MRSATSALPTSGKHPTVLLDTSAAIAFVQPSHEFHDRALHRLATERMGLAGHALFETYSVLTRLPPPNRLDRAQARRLVEHNFPATHHLSARAGRSALATLEDAGVAGGSVYDGLVALAAREAGVTLVTCDRRATPTYQTLAVRYEYLA